MNRHMRSVLLTMGMAFVLALGGCASKSAGGMSSSAAVAYSAATTQEAAMDIAEMEYAALEEAGLPQEVTASAVDADAQISQRKLVRRAEMRLEAEVFEEAMSTLLGLVEQSGGYIESQEISGSSLTDQYADMRYARIDARIPSDKLDEVMDAVGGACNVLSQNESVEDITDSYFDADARLSSLQLQEERLLEILSKADKLEDVITLEQALSEVRYEIESLMASLRRMDSQVTYSYLHLSLNEVQKYTEINEVPRTFGQKLSEAFKTSGRKVARFSENFLLGAIENLPVVLLGLLFWGIMIIILVKFIQFLLRRTGVLGKHKPSAGPTLSSSAYRPIATQTPEPDAKQEKKDHGD